jgi:hypothetical protein
MKKTLGREMAQTSNRYSLWKHLLDEHGLTLLDSEVNEIVLLAVAGEANDLREALREALDLVKAGAEFAGDAAQASGVSAKQEHRIYEHECKCDTFVIKAKALIGSISTQPTP